MRVRGTTRLLTGVVLTIGIAALMPATAGATGSGIHPHHHAAPVLTDAQRRCLADHGVTLPTHRSHLDAARAVLMVALHDCGIGGHHDHSRRHGLSAAERQCLADHGVTLPTRGSHLDDVARAALMAALRECGVIGSKTHEPPTTVPSTPETSTPTDVPRASETFAPTGGQPGSHRFVQHAPPAAFGDSRFRAGPGDGHGGQFGDGRGVGGGGGRNQG
jgi:hypothetical protein